MRVSIPNTSSLRRLFHHYRHMLTVQNISLVVALVIACSWVWGAIVSLQKNYQHQQQVDANNQKIAVLKLQNQNYRFQQAYYKSDEFLELSARQKLGLAQPGEKLILLPSSDDITDTVVAPNVNTSGSSTQDNVSKWLRLFSGR